MRRLVLLVLITVATSTSLHAQAAPPAGERLTVPPRLMVAPLAPRTVPEPPATHIGKPANICRELVAFVEWRAGAKGDAVVAPPSLAPSRPSQSATESSSGPPAIDKPQHASGLVAPIPPGETAAKPPLITIEQARAHASANDLRACQEAVQQMRRAGVALSDALNALGALRLDLLESEGASR